MVGWLSAHSSAPVGMTEVAGCPSDQPPAPVGMTEVVGYPSAQSVGRAWVGIESAGSGDAGSSGRPSVRRRMLVRSAGRGASRLGS